ATPEVNFHGTDPTEWLAIYDPLQASKEARSFYVPFVADPAVGGRALIGMEHVWRTDDHGGDYVVAIARTPSDTNTLWAATRTGRLWVSKDANAANPNNVHFVRIATAATP